MPAGMPGSGGEQDAPQDVEMPDAGVDISAPEREEDQDVDVITVDTDTPAPPQDQHQDLPPPQAEEEPRQRERRSKKEEETRQQQQQQEQQPQQQQQSAPPQQQQQDPVPQSPAQPQAPKTAKKTIKDVLMAKTKAPKKSAPASSSPASKKGAPASSAAASPPGSASNQERAVVLHKAPAVAVRETRKYEGDGFVARTTSSGRSLGSLGQYCMDWNAADMSEVSSGNPGNTKLHPAGASNLAQKMYGAQLALHEADKVAAVSSLF